MTGSIPSKLGLLTQLRSLDLSFNQLAGSLPFELGLLSQLTVAVGSPEHLVEEFHSISAWLRNNQLAGGSLQSELVLFVPPHSAGSPEQLTDGFHSELGFLTQLSQLYGSGTTS